RGPLRRREARRVVFRADDRRAGHRCDAGPIAVRSGARDCMTATVRTTAIPHANTAVRTSCPYCGVGCGVLARRVGDGTSAEIAGDPQHPANFGSLCSKGAALGDTVGLEERLLYPQ